MKTSFNLNCQLPCHLGVKRFYVSCLLVQMPVQTFELDMKEGTASAHNEPDVLSNQKTDLGSRGDVELLVLHLHGISSGLQHSSVIISLSVIVYVPQNASSFARMCHNPKV